MKIGVFDSGIGGLSVARAIEKALPDDEVVFRNDPEHVPYGSRTPDELYTLVTPLFDELVSLGCKAIVIACNTVSTTIVGKLRDRYTIPLVAMEPMIKPAAAHTKSGVIAVCATPATLASERYNWLKKTYANTIHVVEPDCSDWARMIEHDAIDEQHIRDRIEAVCDAGADVIVLGCTHYHWIEDLIKKIANERSAVIQPEQPVIAQLKRVLGRPV